MSLIFKPNGQLDIATEATDLPESSGQGFTASGAMQRCQNLRVERSGRAYTRYGSSRINSAAITGDPLFLGIQDGTRYAAFGTALYADEVSISTGLAATAWTGFRYKSFNEATRNFFITNGTDKKRLSGTTAYEWGISAPTVAPTISVGASTGLTGDYNVKYTYARKSGSTVISESNPSPAAASAVELTNGSLSIAWTASSDSQVTHVRVYRTLANGAVYFHDQDVAIGTTTLDTTTADGSLGSSVETDHDRPPNNIVDCIGPFYNGVCFALVGHTLYWSKPKQPEYWPAANGVELAGPDEPGLALVSYSGQVYVFSKYGLWYIQGTGGDVFHPIRMPVSAGAQGANGAFSVAGRGIYHTGPDGIYFFSGGVDRKVTEALLEPIFHGESVNGVPVVSDISSAWMVFYQNRLYFHYGSGSVIVFNLSNERVEFYQYDERLFSPVVDEKNNRLLAIDNSGYVRILESKPALDDAGTSISWDIESKDFTLQTRAHFPRWAKYDVAAAGASSCTAGIYLDGVLHQTHVLSEDRKTRRRLIDTGNGERCSIRLNGSGQVTIYTVEME